MTEQELREMKLHEVKTISGKSNVCRVVGGWIYNIVISQETLLSTDYRVNSVFVPEQITVNNTY